MRAVAAEVYARCEAAALRREYAATPFARGVRAAVERERALPAATARAIGEAVGARLAPVEATMRRLRDVRLLQHILAHGQRRRRPVLCCRCRGARLRMRALGCAYATLAALAACVRSHVQAHQQLLWRMSALGVVELAPSSLGFMYSKNRC